MNIANFKLWFQGFSDSIPLNSGLTNAQFIIIKRMVDQLGKSEPSEGGSGDNAQVGLGSEKGDPRKDEPTQKDPLEEYVEIIRRAAERAEKEKATRDSSPYTWPQSPFGGKYLPGLPFQPRGPSVPHSAGNYPQIWLTDNDISSLVSQGYVDVDQEPYTRH